MAKLLIPRGGVWGGVVKDRTSSEGRRIFFQCYFRVFFQCVSRGVPGAVFFDFGWLLGSLGRSLLEVFCEKSRFFQERGRPRFCHTQQCFGAIFVVWPSQECMKCGKKGLWKLVFF